MAVEPVDAVRSQLNVEPGRSAHWDVDAPTSDKATVPAGVPPGEPVDAAEIVARLNVVPQNVFAVAFVNTFSSTEVVWLFTKMSLRAPAAGGTGTMMSRAPPDVA